MRNNQGLLNENTLVVHYLSLGAHKWGDQLCLMVVRRFQEWLSSIDTFHWDTWHYKKLLSVAGYQSNPDLKDRFKIGWNTNSRIWEQWKPDVDQFLRILFFRKNMQEELAG